MERLYSVLEIRSTNDELREFEGIASSGALDDHGTVIEPSGARFSLPIPLLWFHDQQTPVGEITEARLIGGRWHVKGSIRQVNEPGRVKDATDQAWHSLKYKLVRGLSIGFKSLKEKGNRFIEWAWRELSLVTIPSNQEASILAVRSAYLGALADSPGVSGPKPTTTPRPKMTIQEQITQHENSRAAKVARQSALMEAAGANGETLGETEAEEYDTLTREVEAIDGHLTRLSSLKRANETQLTPVNGSTITAASNSRGNGEAPVQNRNGVPIVRVKPNTEPGIQMARHVMSLAVSKGNRYEAAEYARRTWGDGADEVYNSLQNGLMTRAPVAPGTTTNATFAAPLVQTNFVNEFLELLRPQTLLGRIPKLRHVPFNTSMPAQTAGGTYKWVGQGKMKPVTNAQYASVTLGFAKASGIIVLTEELVRLSTPSAEQAVRDEMLAGIRQFLDGQFVDPTVAAVANVNPASITNGVAGTAASGTTGEDARSDLIARIAAYAAANFGLGGLVILMRESDAFILGTVLDGVGNRMFPNIGISGGELLGVPVVTSETVGAQIIFAHAPSILMADDGGIEIDISREASLELNSAPTEPPDATAVMTSLWQANLVGIRVERYITWGKARATAVDRIHTVAYSG